MELIPILSTIILVATISTFLLAIGAYLLYKIREGRGQQMAAPIPSTIKAELMTPAEAPFQLIQQPEQRMVPQPIYMEPQPVPVYKQGSVFVQPQQQQQRPVGPQYAPQPRQFSEAGYSEIKNYSESKSENKFLKYTGDGYVAPDKKEKSSGALKWK